MTPERAGPPPYLGGTWGAVLLPLAADGSIDLSRLAAELDVLVVAGLAGVYTCGTAGEFHTLDEDEFDTLSELVAAKATAAGVPFQIGASHMSGQTCLSRTRRARSWPRPLSRSSCPIGSL